MCTIIKKNTSNLIILRIKVIIMSVYVSLIAQRFAFVSLELDGVELYLSRHT